MFTATAGQYASMIMSNSQLAIRSAKETSLDVLGRTLDDALRLETFNAYSCWVTSVRPGSGWLSSPLKRNTGRRDNPGMDRELPIIHVQCYAGYKADERPVSFILDGQKVMMEKVIDQWRSPDFEYFRVLADDGKGYLLRNDPQKAEWVLEKVFEG